MFRAIVVLMLLGLFIPQAQASQSLSQAYATPMWLRLDDPVADDQLDKIDPEQQTAQSAPFSPAPSGDAGQTDVAGIPSQQVMALGRARYDSGRRIHIAGNVMGVVGAAAVVPLGFTMIVAVFDSDERLAVTFAALTLTAAVTSTVGVYMSTIGAMRATRGIRDGLGIDLSTGVGVAGIVFATAGLLMAPTGFGAIGLGVGLVCGVVQMAIANRGLASVGLVDLRVGPGDRGLALSGRF